MNSTSSKKLNEAAKVIALRFLHLNITQTNKEDKGIFLLFTQVNPKYYSLPVPVKMMTSLPTPIFCFFLNVLLNFHNWFHICMYVFPCTDQSILTVFFFWSYFGFYSCFPLKDSLRRFNLVLTNNLLTWKQNNFISI